MWTCPDGACFASLPRAQYYVSQKQDGFNNKIHSFSILLTFIFKFGQGLYGLKYLCPVISVKIKRLPGNTENWLFTGSWTARCDF